MLSQSEQEKTIFFLKRTSKNKTQFQKIQHIGTCSLHRDNNKIVEERRKEKPGNTDKKKSLRFYRNHIGVYTCMFRYRLNNLSCQDKYRKSISNPTYQNQMSRNVTKTIIMKKARSTACDRGKDWEGASNSYVGDHGKYKTLSKRRISSNPINPKCTVDENTIGNEFLSRHNI